MSITVGICTNNTSSPEFLECYKSFETLGAEIIVASQKFFWITGKKNYIAEFATGDYLCLVHDYYVVKPHWYTSMLRYTETMPNVDVFVSAVYTREGRRSADWLVNPNHILAAIEMYPELSEILKEAAPHENGPQYVAGLPYNVSDLTDIQYISGGYIFCKRDVLLETPFNTKLGPGDSEDVEWSERIIQKGAKLAFAKGTYAEIIRPNKWSVTEMPTQAVELLRKYNDRRKTHNL